MLKLMMAGESHGQAMLAIVEGLPAGVPVRQVDIDRHLWRRQLGYGRGGRMQIERDRVRVLSGIRGGHTLGSPVSMVVENLDWQNWQPVMEVWGETSESAAFTCPRPGHADLAGGMKYGHRDLRNVLERASARETVSRVAAGALVRTLLRQLGVVVGSHVLQVGDVRAPALGDISAWTPDQLEQWQEGVDGASVRCADQDANRSLVSAIDGAASSGHSLGGVFEVVAVGLPPGLGSHVHPDRRLDGWLAGALMSIPGVKAVEIGDGWSTAGLTGQSSHDEIVPGPDGPTRLSNRSGGVEGGVTTGAPLVIRCAMKPISTQVRALRTVDLGTGAATLAHVERADTCAVPAAAVVGEAEVAMVVARAALEKFGGDNLSETRRNLDGYLREVSGRWVTGI